MYGCTAFLALLQRLISLSDRFSRPIEQSHIHGQRRPKSVLRRDYQCFNGLGGLLLGNAISQSYVSIVSIFPMVDW